MQFSGLILLQKYFISLEIIKPNLYLESMLYINYRAASFESDFMTTWNEKDVNQKLWFSSSSNGTFWLSKCIILAENILKKCALYQFFFI